VKEADLISYQSSLAITIMLNLLPIPSKALPANPTHEYLKIIVVDAYGIQLMRPWRRIIAGIDRPLFPQLKIAIVPDE
jgi:hypothetical protein